MDDALDKGTLTHLQYLQINHLLAARIYAQGEDGAEEEKDAAEEEDEELCKRLMAREVLQTLPILTTTPLPR